MKLPLRSRFVVSTAAFSIALVFVSCSKEPDASGGSSGSTAAASPSPATHVDETFGFMGQIPADVEFYIGYYNSKNVWRRLVHSKAYAALRDSNLFRHGFEMISQASPKGQDALHFFSPNGNTTISNPKVLKLRHVIADALGSEFFLSFAPGAAQDLQGIRDFQREYQIQQMKGGTKNAASMQAALPALAPYIETLQAPPVVMGFKMSTQKPQLQEEIDMLKARLPAGVTTGTFNLGDKPFTSWTFVAGSVLSPERQQKVRAYIEGGIPDKTVADRYVQSLMARKVEVAFGYAGDYFLVSVGADHSHLKLAASPGESLLHRPELSVLNPYVGKNIWFASWTAQKAVEILTDKNPSVAPFFEALEKQYSSSLTPADTEQLDADLRRIDTKSRALLRPTISQAAVGVSFWENGLHGEQYGGVLPIGLATGKALTMGATDVPSNFLWENGQIDPVFTAGAVDLLEDVTTTAFNFYHRSLQSKLPDAQRQQFALGEALALPRLLDLYHITRDQLCKSLGTECAMVVDLSGAAPALPQVPPAVQQQGKIPRVAYISSVQDEKLLEQSWQSYLALARQITQMLPPGMQMAGGVPQPQKKDLGGAEMFFYPLPMNTGDFLPNITLSGGKDFIASTSPDLATSLSGALAKGGPSDADTAFKLDVHMSALYDFVQTWIDLLSKNPQLMTRPGAAGKFQKSEPHLVTLLKAVRVMDGLEMRFFEENGGLRASSVIHLHDIK